MQLIILRIGNKLVCGSGNKLVKGFSQIRNSLGQQVKYGFALAEVLLTVVILGVGLIGILRAYGAMLNALGASQDYIEEVCLAKEKITEAEQEELTSSGIPYGVVKGNIQGMYQDFNWSREVAPSASKGLSIVKVSVFKKNNPSLRGFSLVSYVSHKE